MNKKNNKSKKISLMIILFISLMFTNRILYSQVDYSLFNFVEKECPLNVRVSPQLYPPPYIPPETGDNYFRVILVYVMFDNEPQDPNNIYWPANTTTGPTYKGTMLATRPNQNVNWWEAYDPTTQTISSYFMEVSKGKLNVIGDEYFIKLDHNYEYYQQPEQKETQINKEIYTKLTHIPGFDWCNYDQWEYHPNTGTFTYNPDNVIDFIYKVHRYRYPNIFSEEYMNASGFAYLGSADNQCHYLVDSINNKYVYGSFPECDIEYKGSGVSLLGNTTSGVLNKLGLLSRLWHEHGHYFFGGGHGWHGIMGSYFDIFFGPLEKMFLGYDDVYTSNTRYEEILLSDIAGRDQTHTSLLKIPQPNSTNMFLITNRQDISPYDRQMYGDSTKGEILKDTPYGKGVYIYHVSNNVGISPTNILQDVECSDGLWNWVQTGFDAPDWDLTNNWLPVLKRTNAVRGINDDGFDVDVTSNPNCVKDGIDIRGRTNNNYVEGKWFSIGKKETTTSPAIDRMYANEEQNWTSRENGGDRYDVWNPEVNEIFGPYSSPNTYNWDNNNSGIFVWIKSYNPLTRLMTIDVFRDEAYNPGNGMPLATILQLTPPSRPIGINISTTPCNNNIIYPVITWEHNIEPDMLQGTGNNFKRYKILRAYDVIGKVPGNYVELADLMINKDLKPSYTDYSCYSECSNGFGANNYILRYKVKAVDNTGWESVPSDFVSSAAIELHTGQEGDSFKGNSELPTSYNLEQNYPNPFNPVTKINFAIPKQGFVTLKVYDMLGREVTKLVNEVKQAGTYSVDFDATRLSSGVYFYKLEAGSFVDTKRMVLVK
jgi:hypothetical protein